MEQVPNERKEALTKTFAIVGFVAIILFAVWLAVQIVSLIPSAFSSLASIADSVYNYRPETQMQVVTGESVVNAGEPFTISWTKQKNEGLYTFSYKCTEGVSLSIRNKYNEVIDLACDTDIELDDSGSAEVTVESEKQRFIDVPYTVMFTGVDGDEQLANGEVTIINASIPTSGLASEETEEEPEEVTPEPEVAGETTTNTTPVVAGEPEVVRRVIYAIPTSDPNGDVDLAIKLLGVGILTDDNRFIRTGVIEKSQMGAFQFEVRNLGTKTSNEWTYEAAMPADIDYDSGDQKELKPNEYAIITLGFEGITKTGVEPFSVKIKTDDDVVASNNSFTSAVTIK